MALPLPDLDTRRFPELAEEARASVPRLAPRWTDHNLSDPGITLTELVSAETDRLMYGVNRITDRDRRTLLRLLGFPPLDPVPASGVVAFALAGAAAAPRTLPAGLALVAADGTGAAVPLVLREPVRVGRAALGAVLAGDPGALAEGDRPLASGEGTPALGEDPSSERSSALYVGLAPAPEPGEELQLALALTAPAVPAAPGTAVGRGDPVVVWEWYDGAAWRELPAEDGTAALTTSGRVRLRIGPAIPTVALAPAPSPLAWVRCRLAAGRPDAAPWLRGVAVHAAAVDQAATARTRFRLDAAVAIPPGRSPVPGAAAPLALTVDAGGAITALASGPPLPTPDVHVLELSATALLAAAVAVGRGERRPRQALVLPGGPAVAATVAAWVVRPTPTGLEGESIRLVPDLDASGPHDTVAVLDAARGVLVSGDGRRGRMLAPDELVLARYERTLGQAGNLRAASACRLDLDPDGPNDALLGGAAGGVAAELLVRLPWPIAGGTDAEDVEPAAGRAARRLSAHERLLELLPGDRPATLDGLDPAAVDGCEPPERALTAPDLERIVLATPGRRVARARAFAELDAALPALRAAGTASVVVLPSLPADRPQPTTALLDAVRAEVGRRRIVGSRIVVTGPTYVDVSVRAALALTAWADAATTLAAARNALDAYLHPLTGGPEHRGWPFGRDVYRADILAVLDGVAGVASVTALELLDGQGRATCGNVCVAPTALVGAGAHELTEAAP